MKKTIILVLAAVMSMPIAAVASINDSSIIQTDKKEKKQKAEIKDVTFHVHLHCKNCVAKVFDNISREKGVKDLNVSLEKQTVAIKYDATKTSEKILKDAIVKLGYPVADHAE